MFHRRPTVVVSRQRSYQVLEKINYRQRCIIHQIITSPYVPPSPQPQASVASSPTGADTLMISGAPNWVPPVGQTYNTGVTGGGADSHPPGLLYCTKGFYEQSAPKGLSVRKHPPGILPQGTSTGQGCQEMTPYTLLNVKIEQEKYLRNRNSKLSAYFTDQGSGYPKQFLEIFKLICYDIKIYTTKICADVW